MRFKVWVEIEVIDEEGWNPQDSIALPDCVGDYATKEEALARQWEITQKYCDDPQNSDARPR